MKRLKSVSFLLLALFFLVFPAISDPVAEGESPLSEELALILEPGDVILIGGDAIWLRLSDIGTKDGPTFGHVGVVTRAEGEIEVSEASGSPVSDGKVGPSTLSHFLRDADYAEVLRPADPGPFLMQVREVASRAKGFDRDFRLTSTDYVYCSELVALALEPIDPRPMETVQVFGREVIYPNAIRRHPAFKTVWQSDPTTH